MQHFPWYQNAPWTYLAGKKTLVSSQPWKRQDEFSYQKANGGGTFATDCRTMSPLFNSGALLCGVTDGQIKAVGCKGREIHPFFLHAVGMAQFSEELSAQLCHCNALHCCC